MMKTKTAWKKARLGLAIVLLAPALCAPSLVHTRSALHAQGVAKIDAAGADAIAGLIAALGQADEASRIRAALPFLHRSLLSADGRDLDPNVKRVAWKKAVANAGGLQEPMKIVRVRSKGNLTIGEGSKDVERGRVDDYFIARRDPDALPARVSLFFPQEGEPKVYDLSGI